jgi:hypothetical protein
MCIGLGIHLVETQTNYSQNQSTGHKLILLLLLIYTSRGKMFEMSFILMTFTHVILYLIFRNGPAFQEVDHV